MKMTIIDGHPDPSPGRLNHALADRYAATAAAAGHEIRRIDVAELEFPLLRTMDEFAHGEPPPAICEAQDAIRWADHIVMFFPLWMSDVPALFKAFFEQTFRPNFALGENARGFPKPLLKGKSARVIVTMGMPALVYRTVFGEHMIKLLRQMLGLAGIRPFESTLLGSVEAASERTKNRWFEEIERVARVDGERRVEWIAPVAAALVRLGVLALGGYAAYVATSWARYGTTGKSTEPDTLIDRHMPDYEVVLRYATIVHAPARLAYEALRKGDLDRSPLVRFLFAMRDVVMRAKRTEAPPELHLPQILALGWTILEEEPGHELVLGTVTKPWQANVPFRAVGGSAFRSFNDIGYAKIAFTLRVDPVSSEHCELRTETRVVTTDPISRARFRRYWAFLSPGMAVIRRLLLQQVKHDAESAWAVQRQESEQVPASR